MSVTVVDFDVALLLNFVEDIALTTSCTIHINF